MKNKVSVIAGVYFPSEVCFRRFIDACLGQTLENIEFIFLLDSTEDIQSRNILKEYKSLIDSNKNKFTIIENDTNLGVVDTYLKGCSLSNSDYILIVDSDDFFDEDLIDNMYNYFIQEKLDFLTTNILISYIGKLDIFYNLYGNKDPDDTCIMFKKEILNYYRSFKNNINNISIQTIKQDGYKADTLPISYCSFYYYTVTDKSATSSFILQNNDNIPKHKDFNKYHQIVKSLITKVLSDKTNKNIDFDNFSINELSNIAKEYVDLDNLSDNYFSYDDLKGI